MILSKIIKKIISIPKLIKDEGLDAFYYRILSNLGFKIKYRSTIEKRRYFLDQMIIDLSKKKIMSGLYKDCYLGCHSHQFKYGGHSSRLLGIYEEQVQLKINELSKDNNLLNIVCFGAADGYHAIGSLKNDTFKSGYAFEVDGETCDYLLDNRKKNNLEKNLKVFCEKANFKSLEQYLQKEDLDKTLFLIDIEGDEYELFDEINIEKYKKSFFIVEDHFFYDNKDKRNYFFELIKKNFKVSLIRNSARDPFSFKILDDLSDDDKWLIMGEGRPKSMNWIVLTPLINGL